METIPVMGEVEHPLLHGLKMRRCGNEVSVRYASKEAGSHAFSLDRRIYYHDLFEHDDKWTLSNVSIAGYGLGFQIELLFTSNEDRTKVLKIASDKPEETPIETTQHDETTQTLDVMVFQNEPDTVLVVLEHVGGREFIRSVTSKLDPSSDWDRDFRYEYAIFRDDESVLFNCRPDETGAKPVTVAYLGGRVEQV